MSNSAKQSSFFRGIYEFEDPSGTLIAAKVPAAGTVDLYAGTAVIVKPNQCAVFIYQGKIADLFFSGTHQIKTESVPILTKLANWKFGFENPLRCELVFVAGHAFTSRRWGSPQPILVNFDGVGAVPIRAFGNFNVVVTDPAKFYTKLVGSRTAYSITDLEEFIQGQIVELLPEAFSSFKSLADLSKSYSELSKHIEPRLNEELKDYGVAAKKVQVLSALPSKEVIEAMDAKAAIQVIGSQKEYLLYKAATSLGQSKDGASNDSMQMMMGLMLGKGLIGADYHEKEEKVALEAKKVCTACNARTDSNSKFCSQCGKGLL